MMDENIDFEGLKQRVVELEKKLLEYEQKGAEKHLREMARRFEKIAEMGDDGIIVFDEQYKIEFANTVASELTEYPKERLMGMDFRHLLTKRDHGYLDRRHPEGGGDERKRACTGRGVLTPKGLKKG